MIFVSPHSSVPVPEISLPELALNQAERLKDKIAFIDGGTGQTISYGEASRMIDSLAASLRNLGMKRGDVLALYAGNRPEYPIVAHGAMLAGATVTPINPMYSVAEANKQLCATQARVLVTTASLMDGAREAAVGSNVEHIVSIDEHPEALPLTQLLGDGRALSAEPCNPREDVAVLPFSSGTTGLPKGVMLTHYNLVANTSQFLSLKLTQEDDVVLSLPPICHIYGWTVVVNVVMPSGATTITMPQFQFEPFLQLLQKYKVTQTFVAPSIVQLLATHPLVEKYDLSSLRVVVSAGAPLSGELSESCSNRLNCLVIQAYGMTEAGPITHFGSRHAERNRTGTIGQQYPDTLCRIIDITTKEELGPDCLGEILVKGPQVMKGYLNNPEATSLIIDKDGWLHTGDVGKVDKDGYLTVSDRIKELIKYKGFQVPPAELEGVLLQHPAVADAAVIPHPHSESGEIPLALVVRRGSVTESQLMEFVAERVTSYKRVRAVEFVEEIPKTPSGKILRRILVEQQRERLLQRPAAAVEQPS
jgi:acyl-CoA synthetase (AMP-forming)/AMP-acid ligase II